MTQRITALILTFNEQKHIGRCLRSLQGIADQIIVVDSGSTDRTTELCNEMGAEVLHHTWHNYSTQFNWGLDNAEIRGDWVLRIDADEYLNEPLREALKDRVLGGRVGAEVGGLYLHRVMVFMGRPIRWGGCGDLHMLRLFRRDIGRCEERWMDEHISISSGRTEALPGELMDENLNNIGWWINKHNGYSTREAIDLLNIRYGFETHTARQAIDTGSQASRKRWVKERIYANLPVGLRSGMYFVFRYIFQLGFLDARAGLVFHFMQAFWYRFLVDLKVTEIQERAAAGGRSIEQIIEAEYGFKVGKSQP